MANFEREPLAVIGSACILPGANSVEEFWNNISAGKISITDLRKDRILGATYPAEKGGQWGKTNSFIGAKIDFQNFNKNIKPRFIETLVNHGFSRDALDTDTGRLIPSYVAYEAIRSAGLNPFALPNRHVGVFTGMVRTTESHIYYNVERALPFLREMISRSGKNLSSKEKEIICADLEAYVKQSQKELAFLYENCGDDDPHQSIRQIQRLFHLEGIGYCFDNACSSSLAALYFASRYLSENPDGFALCGGMSVLSKGCLCLFSYNQASSSVGSFPMDQRADGLVIGEGCSYLLVRPLSRAIAAGNPILGVIRGVGASCDGKGKGLWAPMSEGQALAISRAMKSAGVNETVFPDWVEAHATSTSLGDASELQAIKMAFSRLNLKKNAVPITSVKANIGHLLEAAGATGIIKILESFKNEVILPQVSFQQPTERFSWDESPLYVPLKPISWPKKESERPRMAMINAFGIGGLNATVLLEGPEAAAKKSVEQSDEKREKSASAVAVIGIGCVLPGATGGSELRQRIQSGQSALSEIPTDRADLLLDTEKIARFRREKIRAGFVENFQYDWKRHQIPPKHIAAAHPLQFWILDAVDQAIDAAGLPKNIKASLASPEKWDRAKTAVVVGTMTNSDFIRASFPSDKLVEIKDSMSKSMEKLAVDEEKADEVLTCFENDFFQKFSNKEDVTGGFSISTLGTRIAKSYDLMGPVLTLDGGYSASLMALKTACSLLRDGEAEVALCASGVRCQGTKLEKYREGAGRQDVNPPAEGSVAFVLKRAEDALAAGDTIYAIIDDIHAATYTEKGCSANRENQTTVTDAFSGESDSGFCEAIQQIMGDFGPMNGGVYLAAAALDMRRFSRDFPSFLASENVENGVGNEKSFISDGKESDTEKPVSVLIKHEDRDGVNFEIRMENSFSYLHNKKSQNLIEKDMSQKDISQKELTDVPVQEVEIKIKDSLRAEKNKDRVAFLFTGQGAQYPNMMSNFQTLPGAADIISEMDALLQEIHLPDFKTVLWSEGNKLGKDTFRTQLSLLMADTFIYQLYSRQGIKPDILLGHSYGEYPAMVAAGVWDFQTAAEVTEKRCRAIEQVLEAFTARRTRTTMLSTNASEDQIQEAMNAIPDSASTLYVSNRNAPTQTIISGTYEAIKKMEAFLLEHQRLALILPIPAAFHSPLVEGVCKPFAEAVKPFVFHLPSIALLSSVTGNFESDPDIFRANLIQQMTKPVDFIQMVRKAYNNGCRRFVEIGPKKTLTNLAKQILSDCSDVTFFTTDNGKGGDPEQFLEICRQLKSAPSAAKCVSPESLEKKTETSVVIPAPIVRAPGISICRQSGSPYQMGVQYGKQYALEIRSMIRRYVDIVGMASERMLPPLPAMDEKSLVTRFGESGLEEIRGMAEGAGVPMEALIRHNICLFPTKDTMEQKKIYRTGVPQNTSETSVSNSPSGGKIAGVRRPASGCVQFAGTTPNGALIHGCNMDLPFKRIVPDGIQVQLQTRHPQDGIPHCFVGVTGMAGTIGGFNAHGLCVSSCTLFDFPTAFTTVPELKEHSTLTRQILAECSSIDQALELIYQNGAIGGWTMALSEGGSGRIAQVEYHDKMVVHRGNIHFLAQANHSQLLVEKNSRGKVAPPEHSLLRQQRLLEILTQEGSENRLATDALTAFSALRDVKSHLEPTKFHPPGAFRTINMILRVDNVCSWMFNHTAQTLMVACTPDAFFLEDDKSLWEQIPVHDLLPEYRPIVVTETSGIQANFPVRADAEIVKSEFTPRVKKEVPQEEPKEEVSKLARKDILCLTGEAYSRGIQNYTPDGQKNVTWRYVDCLLEAPERMVKPTVAKKAFVLGDVNGPIGVFLQKELEKIGCRPVLCSLEDFVREDSSEKLEAKIRELLADDLPYDIFVVAPENESGCKLKTGDWNRLRDKWIVPFYSALQLIYRKVVSEKQVEKLRIVAATRMGGDMGYSGTSEHLEGGAVAGLLRNLRMEILSTHKKVVNIKTVDFPEEMTAEKVSERLIYEISCQDPVGDICYKNGKRHYLVVLPENAPRRKKASTKEAKEVWVITGGARGITAKVAHALGKERNAVLYLVGSSPLPQIKAEWRHLSESEKKALRQTVVREALEAKKKPAEEWAKVEKALEVDASLRQLDKDGIKWRYCCCDLASSYASAELIKNIIQKEGKITGVIHGAGFEKSGVFDKKERRNVQKTLDVKVGSLFSMLENLSENPPEYFVMMASTAGRLGGNGQTDYGMSNYLSAKVLNRFEKMFPECKTCTIHWNAWGEVGMSVRPESLIVFKSIGMPLMPVQEGINHLLDELQNEEYASEITPIPNKLLDGLLPAIFESLSENEKHKEDGVVPKVMIYGQNADAYALRKLVQEKGVELESPVLMSCRDEQLSKMMTDAQKVFRVKRIFPEAIQWIRACLKNGYSEVIVPTGDSLDSSTDEFLRTIKKIITVRQIPISWTLHPEECAEIILRGKNESLLPERSSENDETEKSVENVGQQEKTNQEKSFSSVLLNNISRLTEDVLEVECLLDPKKDTFLLEHQLKGRPILPVVIGMEIIAEASRVLSVKLNLEPFSCIRDMKIMRGMSFLLDTPCRLACVMERTDDMNVWNVLLKGDLYNNAGKKISENCPYYKCQVVFGAGEPVEKVWVTDELKNSFELKYPKLGEISIYHGPSLQSLKSVRYNDESQMVGQILSQENRHLVWPARQGEPELYPAVIDACLYTCALLHNVSGEYSVSLPDYTHAILKFSFRLRQDGTF
ncbi:MAG: C45 family autoproteolytic acyltransferase/hydrolase, partial [Planctomycetia bacterium]|nr:C45 family autoproteolytic acyltransferase/hydrolase [Planctomycetia bacterium]